jgi:hypothetical protein
MLKKIIKYSILTLLTLLILAGLKIEFIGKKLEISSVENYILKSENKNKIRLTFLGTSGFIINYNNKQIVCDPFFSNPNIYSTIFSTAKLPKLNNFIADSLYNNVSMITISHGHFDHCMDIQNFLQNENTTIVSDRSNLLMLNSVIQKNPTIEINHELESDWIYDKDSTFRVLPIASVHAPHIANITFLDGIYENALTEFPQKLWQWKMGKCNSFLVDVLQNDSISYRIAMLGGKLTEKSEALLMKNCKERNCNMLAHIYWNKDRNYDDITRINKQLKPTILLLHHWNSFFGNVNKPVEYFKTTNLPEELKNFKMNNIDAKIMIPFTSVDL